MSFANFFNLPQSKIQCLAEKQKSGGKISSVSYRMYKGLITGPWWLSKQSKSFGLKDASADDRETQESMQRRAVNRLLLQSEGYKLKA
jgi:hypothetical protein